MDTVEPHGHTFPSSEWPFSDPENVLTIEATKAWAEIHTLQRHYEHVDET